jgi:putative transposase
MKATAGVTLSDSSAETRLSSREQQNGPLLHDSGSAPGALGLHATLMRDRIYVHIVWTTRDRLPLINAGVATFLARYLPAVARQERAGMHALGMVSTHVHLLLKLHPTSSISRLLQRLKGGSSVLANREGHAGPRPLRWAKGYNIESVSPGAIESARAYVLGQAKRHPQEAIPGWDPAT